MKSRPHACANARWSHPAREHWSPSAKRKDASRVLLEGDALGELQLLDFLECFSNNVVARALTTTTLPIVTISLAVL